MEISTVFENEYSQNMGSLGCSKAEWNGRTVTILEGDKSVPFCKAINFRTRVNSMMSKPDHGDATIRGGVDEERGAYIEGSITMSWGDSKPSSDSKKSESPSEKDQSPDTNDSPKN